MKHVGKIDNTGSRVVVVFRVVPNEPGNCLVVYSDSLPNMYHDNLMEAVESTEGQAEFELGNYLGRRMFSNGQRMLEALHKGKFIQKVRVDLVTMTPGGRQEIKLADLNKLIADQKGVTVEDLAGTIDQTDAEIAADEAAASYTGYSSNVGQSVVTDTGLDVSTFEGGPTLNENRSLTDEDLAKNLVKQSESLNAQVEQLMSESKRLTEEAYSLNPSLKPKKSSKPGPKPKKKTD